MEISLRVPRTVTGLRLLVLLAAVSTTSLAQSWYNSSWLYRKKITIDYTKVGSTGAPHSNFPFLVSLSSDADLSARALANGNDILFTSSDGTTKLDYDREKYSSGTLVAWVRIPSLSAAANTDIYMYYGNSGASDQQNATGAWDANYRGVWHLKDDPSGASPQMRDGTSYANHGTSAGGMIAGDQINAQVDGGLNFDGVDDVIDAGSNTSLDNMVPFTFSAWVYPRSMGGQSDSRIMHKGSVTERKQLQFENSGTNDLALYVDRATTVANAIGDDNTATLNQWQYVCGTYDPTDGPRVYRNGVEITYRTRTVGSGSTIDESDFNFYIGNRPSQDKGWDGDIDEVRVSNIVRSTGWFVTEYNNQNSPLTFDSVGAQQIAISGNVFEDVNYGGGAGRNKALSSGIGMQYADVELYNSGGVYVSGTNTDASGNYSFTNLAAGTYYIRVVNDSVRSSRVVWSTNCKPVMTYRTNAATGTAVAVTDYVGGTNPSASDPGVGSSGATFDTTTFVYSAVLTGTAQAVTQCVISSSSIPGVDFGFNFNTIVNTNNTGQGSLRQGITNMNTLGGDGSLLQSGLIAGKDNAVFMISNGTAGNGLRASNNYFSSGVATISPTSALPTISTILVMNAQKQPGWTNAPIIELDGTSAGSVTAGLNITAGSCVIKGFVINRFGDAGINVTTNGSNTVAGNYIGTNAAGNAAAPNGNDGIILNGVTNNTIGGTSANDRNVISGNNAAANNSDGVWITGGSGNFVQGNYIGRSADGSIAIPNYEGGVTINGSSDNTVGGTMSSASNVISGNGKAGVIVGSGTGNAILGNSIYANTTIGIDLNNNGVTTNNGTKNGGQPNSGMDHPVFTLATLVGINLHVSGYVGNSAGQSTFGNARVELFKSDNDATGYGEGQTYLTYITAHSDGNFDTTVTVSGLVVGDKITATATDASNNTSEFGANRAITGSKIVSTATGGNWSNGSTWVGGVAPTGDNPVDVVIGATVTLDGNISRNASDTLTVYGTLECGTYLVSGSGEFTLSSGGTLRIGHASGITSSGATGNIQVTGTRSFNTGANYVYNGSSSQSTGNGLPATVNDLAMNNSGGVSLSASTTVNSTLTLTAGALSVGTRTLTLNGTVSATGGSLTSAATGSVNYNQGSNGQAVLAGTYGNLAFSNFNKVLPASGIAKVTGTFTPGSATGHTITGSTVEYNGSGAQTVGAMNYYNLTLSNAGVKTFATGTTGIAGAFTVTGATADATANSATIDYNGSGTQVVIAVSYHNLVFSNGGAKTVGSSLTVTGNLTIGAATPATVSTGVNVQVNGSITNAGVLSNNSASINVGN